MRRSPALLSSALVGIMLLTGCVGQGLPSHVGEDDEFRISGNVQVDETPVAGVVIDVSNEDSYAKIATDADGRWSAGVTADGDYIVTVDRTSLPSGVAPQPQDLRRIANIGPGGKVTVNFFLGTSSAPASPASRPTPVRPTRTPARRNRTPGSGRTSARTSGRA